MPSLFAFRIFFVSLATSSGVATTQCIPFLHSVEDWPPYAAITDSTADRAPMLGYFDEAKQNSIPENIVRRISGENCRPQSASGESASGESATMTLHSVHG